MRELHLLARRARDIRLPCRFALLILVVVAAGPVAAQGEGPNPAGVNRELMWPAPTAEDWKKPCLITFQRTWEDAVTVSKETGKPILVCINMDGEIASEHYAGVRYRQPEIAALYEPYVCVIASVYRHNPRDYDDEGRRILCPRFGSVTCGEHIWIEPTIFEKFCDGQRVAPRHIAVDLDGKEVYDVYYRNDTASVFADIREKVPPGRPSTVVRGDRPIVERVASRDIADRNAVEGAYQQGDAPTRHSLLDAALKNADAAPVDLLRLAVFGLDVDSSRQARRALAEIKTTDAAQLVSDALQVSMDAAEREALVKTLGRLGENSPLARWLAGVHRGLSGGSSAIDLKAWSEARAKGEYPAPTPGLYGADIMSYTESLARSVEERPEDAGARLDLAEATLALALRAPATYAEDERFARLAASNLHADARRFAREAETLGAKGWRVNTILALSAYYAGEVEEAYTRAAAAVKDIPPGDPGWSSMAVVTVFAEGRWKAIRASVRDGKEWPPEWLADLHTAYTLLLRHPLGTDRQVLWHYDFLDWLGMRQRASAVLREGIARFQDSAVLHERVRDQVLRHGGPEALESLYDRMLQEKADPALVSPFAGIASVACAEVHRRARAYDKAIASYGRAIAHDERAIQADAANKETADPAVALALAGRARCSYELGDDTSALNDILASLARHPGSAGTRDGMGMTPGETAQMLLARLRKQEKAAEARLLEEALATIDPDLLRPDYGLGEPK